MNSETPVVPQSSSPIEKSKPAKSRFFLFCCGGCALLLILCCGISCALLAFAPQAIPSVLLSSNLPADDSLNKLDSKIDMSLIEIESKLVKIKIQGAQMSVANSPKGKKTTLILSEKEILYLIAESMLKNNDSKDLKNLQYFSVGMEPDLLTVQIEAGKLIASNDTNISDDYLADLPIDQSVLNNLVVRVNLTTSSDKRNLVLKDFTTGNAIIDSIVNVPGFKEQINSEIEKADNNLVEGVKITNIRIERDRMVLVLER